MAFGAYHACSNIPGRRFILPFSQHLAYHIWLLLLIFMAWSYACIYWIMDKDFRCRTSVNMMFEIPSHSKITYQITSMYMLDLASTIIEVVLMNGSHGLGTSPTRAIKR